MIKKYNEFVNENLGPATAELQDMSNNYDELNVRREELRDELKSMDKDDERYADLNDEHKRVYDELEELSKQSKSKAGIKESKDDDKEEKVLSTNTDIEPDQDERVAVTKWLKDNDVKYRDYEFDGQSVMVYNAVVPGHLPGRFYTMTGDVAKFNRKDMGLEGTKKPRQTHKHLDSPVKSVVNQNNKG